MSTWRKQWQRAVKAGESRNSFETWKQQRIAAMKAGHAKRKAVNVRRVDPDTGRNGSVRPGVTVGTFAATMGCTIDVETEIKTIAEFATVMAALLKMTDKQRRIARDILNAEGGK